MVGGEHRDHRPRIARADPVGGHQHAGRGAAVGGLGEDVDLREAGQLRPQVAVVAGLGHDHDARGRDQPRDALQGLPQERLGAGQDRILLGPLVTIEIAGERPEPAALPAGQHDGPQIAVALSFPDRGERLAARECLLEHGSSSYPPPLVSTNSNDATCTR